MSGYILGSSNLQHAGHIDPRLRNCLWLQQKRITRFVSNRLNIFLSNIISNQQFNRMIRGMIVDVYNSTKYIGSTRIDAKRILFENLLEKDLETQKRQASQLSCNLTLYAERLRSRSI